MRITFGLITFFLRVLACCLSLSVRSRCPSAVAWRLLRDWRIFGGLSARRDGSTSTLPPLRWNLVIASASCVRSTCFRDGME
ncbi:MAG TPA: hypothetical protein ACQGQF_04945 [Xylella fastidiosa subsp. pauca]